MSTYFDGEKLDSYTTADLEDLVSDAKRILKARKDEQRYVEAGQLADIINTFVSTTGYDGVVFLNIGDEEYTVANAYRVDSGNVALDVY